MDLLTRDNPLLSGPTNEVSEPRLDAINCTPLPQPVAELVRDSIAPNSRRAYGSDLARFQAWGGTLPATDKLIATYLAEHAETHAPSTLTRWLTSLAKAHRTAGLFDPTKSELVRSVLRGIRRTSGRAPQQAKPLLRDDLLLMLDAMDRGLRARRDRALLLVGFAGGFRRSELVGLDRSDAEPVRQGVLLHLRRSKTDQFGQGRRIGVPYARGRHCPVAALEDWLTTAKITAGPLFRPINRHHQVGSDRLSSEAVSIIVRERLAAVGIPPAGYSGHSLRAGFATSAAQAGVSSWKIRQQTGHASDAMLARYVRNGELFLDNAAGVLL